MKVLIELNLPECFNEDKLKDILAKEGICVDKIEKLVEPPYEGWDN
jgi:hypothetical protein